MSGVFKNIDPPTGRRVCNPAFGAGGQDTFAGWRGDGGSIVRKTPDTALYSTYVSTLLVGCVFSDLTNGVYISTGIGSFASRYLFKSKRIYEGM
jgi:hypothetical protein